MTLIDTNVLFDLVTDDPLWARWSEQQLDRLSAAGPLIVNDVIYAELSVRFEHVAEVDAALEAVGIETAPIPRMALFAAGKSYRRYRAFGGTRTGVLPDFFIGAHAAILGIPLLTRDPRRYRTYFPSITLITP